MSEEVKIEGAGKVPRKEKVLYFLRFHAWSLIALGVARYFIGAYPFWSAIGRILNKLERRK